MYHIQQPVEKVYQKLGAIKEIDKSNWFKSPHAYIRAMASQDVRMEPGYWKDETDGQYILEFIGLIHWMRHHINVFIFRHQSQSLQCKNGR